MVEKVDIKRFDPIKVAYMRHTGSYVGLDEHWKKFLVWVFLNDFDIDSVQIIGVNHDQPEKTPEEQLRFDAALAVDEQFVPPDDIEVQEIEGGQYAVLTHQGPYDGLPEKIQWLFDEWLPKSGKKPRSLPVYMLYRNSPMKTAPEDLLTDIHLPLQ